MSIVVSYTPKKYASQSKKNAMLTAELYQLSLILLNIVICKTGNVQEVL